jgi:hypothetical protein
VIELSAKEREQLTKWNKAISSKWKPDGHLRFTDEQVRRLRATTARQRESNRAPTARPSFGASGINKQR